MPSKARNERSVRWWPALVLLGVGAALTVFLFLTTDLNHQERNIRVAVCWSVILLLLALWFFFASRIRRGVRWSVFALLVLVGALVPALIRFHGVTGDLIPVWEWRWEKGNRWETEEAAHVSAPPAHPEFKASLDGAAYPQFLGPERNATVPDPGLSRDWSGRPPREIWRRPIGSGWSGFAVVGRRAVTQEQRADQETVVCYSVENGAELWIHSDSAHYSTALGGEGPRATPTVMGDRVFTLGATGILNCLSLETGELHWSRNIIADHGAEVNEWGMSGSPLALNEWIIVSPGGPDGHSLAAYQQENGEHVWSGGSDRAGYASPQYAVLADIPQILIFNASTVAGHDPATGQLLWDYPWPSGHPHVAMPVVVAPNQLLVSSGYGTGSALVELQGQDDDGLQPEAVWKSRSLKAKFTNVVLHDGYVYGLDDGILACLDVQSGRRMWKDGRYGHGQVILIGELLLVMSEKGDVVLVEPVPTEHRELDQFRAFTDKTWNPPALAGNLLVVRNHKEAAVFELPLK